MLPRTYSHHTVTVDEGKSLVEEGRSEKIVVGCYWLQKDTNSNSLFSLWILPCVKRKFPNVIKLQILRWIDDPGFIWVDPNGNQSIFIKGDRRFSPQRGEWNVLKAQRNLEDVILLVGRWRKESWAKIQGMQLHNLHKPGETASSLHLSREDVPEGTLARN